MGSSQICAALSISRQPKGCVVKFHTEKNDSSINAKFFYAVTFKRIGCVYTRHGSSFSFCT